MIPNFPTLSTNPVTWVSSMNGTESPESAWRGGVNVVMHTVSESEEKGKAFEVTLFDVFVALTQDSW